MSLGSTSLGASRALQEATACLHTTSKTSITGHYWVTGPNGALVCSRVAIDILNTEGTHRVNSVRINSRELIEFSKTGLDWHFLFMPTLCSNSDTWKLLPGSVLRLPGDYWTFYKKNRGGWKRKYAPKLLFWRKSEIWILYPPSEKVHPASSTSPEPTTTEKGSLSPNILLKLGHCAVKQAKFMGPGGISHSVAQEKLLFPFQSFFPTSCGHSPWTHLVFEQCHTT